VEPYTLQCRPLRVKYGDLTDPVCAPLPLSFGPLSSSSSSLLNFISRLLPSAIVQPSDEERVFHHAVLDCGSNYSFPISHLSFVTKQLNELLLSLSLLVIYTSCNDHVQNSAKRIPLLCLARRFRIGCLNCLPLPRFSAQLQSSLRVDDTSFKMLIYCSTNHLVMPGL
jgi:hypothetical protein